MTTNTKGQEELWTLGVASLAVATMMDFNAAAGDVYMERDSYTKAQLVDFVREWQEKFFTLVMLYHNQELIPLELPAPPKKE